MKALRFICLVVFFFGLRELPAQVKPGLVGNYYFLKKSVPELPSIAADAMPSIRRVDSQINFTNTTDFYPGLPFNDYFFVRWTGKIRIPKAATYTFHVSSDDGARLFLYDREILNNDGIHETSEKSGAVELPAGDHDIRLEYYEEKNLSECLLSWSFPGQDKELIPEAALWHVEKPALVRPFENQFGLNGDFYVGAGVWNQLPVLLGDETPSFSRVDERIDFSPTNGVFPGTKLTASFLVRWTGRIVIPVDGDYTFFVESDDGSVLFIDGKKVVDNDKDHPPLEISGEVTLKEGKHDIQLDYFQMHGGIRCRLRWQQPGGDKEIIPTSMLLH